MNSTRVMVFIFLSLFLITGTNCFAADISPKGDPIIRSGGNRPIEFGALQRNSLYMNEEIPRISERLDRAAEKGCIEERDRNEVKTILSKSGKTIAGIVKKAEKGNLSAKDRKDSAHRLRHLEETLREKLSHMFTPKTRDTSLLTTEILQCVNEINRLNSMFSNMLNKLHESRMAVIRNL